LKSNLSGSEQLKKAMSDMAKMSVKTGWFETSRYPDDEKRNRTGGTFVAAVAYWLNKGTPTMVARPFFSDAIYMNENRIKDVARKLMSKVLAGQLSPDEAMGQIGLFIERLIIENIKSQRYAGLTDEYMEWKKKFHSEPQILIDTGLLWQTVISKVEPK
jgi:hypothetical protein